MISYAEAMAKISSLDLGMGTETVALAAAANRVLAADLTAPFPSPRFTNSAMDGFALRRADAEAQNPLPITATYYAEPTPPHSHQPYRAGTCARIMTGAPLPPWADTVVPVEKTTLINDQSVLFLELPALGAHIRRVGEDIAAGAALMSKGMWLNPERIMVLASFGFAEVAVYEKPDVLLVGTGDELVELGKPLPDGGIYNSSRYYLTAALANYGITPVVATVKDQPQALRPLVEKVLSQNRPTLIITTGAVSAGDRDFIPQLAADLGFEKVFHKVAVRPGKPLYLAKKQRCLWLGIPGNPISSATSWQFFGRSLLASWAGWPTLSFEKAKLSHDLKKPEALRCFFRGVIDGGDVIVSEQQGSAHLLASIAANAYIIIFEGQTDIKAGTAVDVLRI